MQEVKKNVYVQDQEQDLAAHAVLPMLPQHECQGQDVVLFGQLFIIDETL